MFDVSDISSHIIHRTTEFRHGADPFRRVKAVSSPQDRRPARSATLEGASSTRSQPLNPPCHPTTCAQAAGCAPRPSGARCVNSSMPVGSSAPAMTSTNSPPDDFHFPPLHTQGSGSGTRVAPPAAPTAPRPDGAVDAAPSAERRATAASGVTAGRIAGALLARQAASIIVTQA